MLVTKAKSRWLGCAKLAVDFPLLIPAIYPEKSTPLVKTCKFLFHLLARRKHAQATVVIWLPVLAFRRTLLQLVPQFDKNILVIFLYLRQLSAPRAVKFLKFQRHLTTLRS
jgi:hypothetical protein